ncbi:MAG: hypothetical protein H7328_07640 [Bdellovibrio sp.]|nr:hypothetical protein [Bdellovibrio sp.]
MVKIKKGSILIYRIFDVAEEINIPRVEAILRDNRGPDQFKVPKYIDRAIEIKNPPVTFGLGQETLVIKGVEIQAEVFVKVRQFGVLSLIYQISIAPGTTWQQLVEFASLLEEGSEIDELALQQVKEVSTSIADTMTKPSLWSSFEDYIIYFFEEFEDGIDAKNLISHADIPALLLAEDQVKLSESTRKSLKEQYYQYSENDLALIEWNSAIVVEPNGSRDVPDILEFAVTQLMEMRFYDDLLDKKLKALSEDVQQKRSSIFTGKHERVYKEATARYIEFIEFIERVENSLKVVGDFYLATLYRASTNRFRLSDWQNNVTRKMNILAQVSNLLQGEINHRRSNVLEIIVIILISYEILMAVWK